MMGAVLSLLVIGVAGLAIVIGILDDVDAWMAAGRRADDEEAQPEVSAP